MKSHSKYTVALLAALLAGLTSTASAEVTDTKHTELSKKADVADKSLDAVYNTKMNSEAVPEGLTGSQWKGIRQAYEQHRHAAVAVDGGFRTRNPGQQWLTHFDGRGFTVEPNGAGWRWGLELQSYGFPGHERALSAKAKMTAKNDRVTYDRGAGLQEWFVNDSRGLEHGFTLNSRPPGTGDRLELRLSVRGRLHAQGQADGQGVSFVNEHGSVVINYAGLKVWDADNRELPARINANAKGVIFSVDEHDARYPLTIDPIAQQAYLKASNTDAFDEFGRSVAVSGDTVVVGAWLESSNATGVNGNQADNTAADSGAAYVFVRDGGGVWSQQAYLKASNTGENDKFGWRVGISDDTVVVTAFFESSNATGVNGNQADDSASRSGAAYVFVRDGAGAWSQQAYLKASNTDVLDLFGFSVSVSGDTVVVGARQESSNATGVNGNQADNTAFAAGAAYVFVRDSSGVWSQQAYLKASNTGPADGFGFNDLFGASVCVSGDTVVVGARGEDSNATGVNGNQTSNSTNSSGAAYVFVRDGAGVWSQQAYLKASNTDASDGFGGSVSVSGDTVVVGADGERSNATGVNGNQSDNSAFRSGAAYVFVRDGAGVWSQQAYLKASNTDASDGFGASVAASGGTVVVAARGEDSNATGVNGNQSDNSTASAGAAYLFFRDGAGVWRQQAYLKASNTGELGVFGTSVSVSGDTVVVGAQQEDSNTTGVNGNQADNSAFNAGAAYVFLIQGVCGDGTIEGGEQCDDVNTADGDGCSSTCAIEAGFTCVGQPSVCTPTVCGDGMIEGAETCDDSGTIDGDGCSSTCATEAGFTCVGQPSVCTPGVCGDGTIEGVEQCDDVNTIDGDGCSSTCVIEGGYSCVGEPSVCTSNDACANSVEIFAGPTAVDTTMATLDGPAHPGHPFCSTLGFDQITPDIWYHHFASCAGYLTLTMCEQLGGSADYDTRIAVYAPGCPATGASLLGCNDDDPINACGTELGGWHSTLVIPVTIGQELLVRVGGFGVAGTGILNIFCDVPLTCGDGVIDAIEQCDDFNAIDGDGCSAICQVEPGFECLGQPSVCVPIVGPCGDLDDDLDVDGDDLAVLLAAFGRSLGHPRYNAVADLDDDGAVTMTDFEIWLTCYFDAIGIPFGPVPVPGLLGDLDADGDIDLADFADFEFCLSDPPGFAFPCIMKFDFDGNSQINIDDYADFVLSMLGP